METVLRTVDLRRSFRTRRGWMRAVDGIDLEVRRGEIVGLLGPNGAGKTTTLRMITTLLPVGGGSVTVAGFDVRTQPQRVRERLGYVSQLGGADEFATARENLMLQARLHGSPRAAAARRAGDLIVRLDLAEFADRPVKTYSGGQRRRLDVALGIVHEPELLFLDEPTTGLDPQNRANLWDHVRALRAAGTTVVLTTHYLEEADALCDRVMIVDHGRIAAEGTPADLKRQVAGDVLLLEFATPAQAERALALVAGGPGVREAASDGAAVRLHVEDGPAALPPLLRALGDGGGDLLALRLSQPTLDDVFLRCTGRSLRDAGAPEGVAG